MPEELLLWSPPEGEAHQLREVPACAQLFDERSNVGFCAARYKRHLSFAYDNCAY